MEQGKLAEAIVSYQRLMDQKPGPQAYSRAAHVRWLKGDLAGAIELMSMSAGTSGTWDREAAAWAHVRLASYELEADRPQTASRLIETALAFQPDYPPALLLRGRLLLTQGKHLEAVSPLRLAASLNPLPEHHWVLAEALKAAGREEEAARVEARLLQQGAKDDSRTFSLYLATTGKNLAVAVRLAEEELKVRSDVFTLDALAWAYRGAGRIQEAQVLSARALAEGTLDARLFYHAGVIAAKAGRNEEAEKRLESARVREQMLLPSERRHLREVLAHCRSSGPPTKSKEDRS